MPDEFERHGRSSEKDWGRGPARSQARAAAAQAGEGPGKKPKNTKTPKKECTASPDGLHHGEPHKKRVYQKKDEPPPDLTCRWRPVYYIRRKPEAEPRLAWWDCYHMEYCKPCGGKLEDSMGERCPDYPGSPGQKLQAEKQTLAWDEERRARGSRSARQLRRTPNGPQGYRKPRSERN